MPSTFFGLPLHVLVVHFVVILVPLAATALIATCWQPEWRARYALPIALLAVGGAVFAFIAAQSGGNLKDTVREAARAAGQRADFRDHPSDGGLAEDISIVFALVVIAFWGVQEYWQRLKLHPWAPTAAYAVSSVVGLIAIWAVVNAGHSGSALVWHDLGNYVKQR